MRGVASNLRVQTYLTLLNSLALSEELHRATPALETKVRAAWGMLSDKERARATVLIETSPFRTALGREHIRLVEDPR